MKQLEMKCQAKSIGGKRYEPQERTKDKVYSFAESPIRPEERNEKVFIVLSIYLLEDIKSHFLMPILRTI